MGSFRRWHLGLYLPNVTLCLLYFLTPWILNGVDTFNGAKGFLYGPCHILWDLQFNSMFGLGFYRFIRSYQASTGVTRVRLRYVVLGTFVGLILAGTTNVIMPWFNHFEFLWLGPPLTLTWLGSIVYAITRYQLMDIRVVVSHGTISVLLHTMAIGAPFFITVSGETWLQSLIGEKWWMVPFGLLAGLSSLVPILYRLLQARAEARIFKTERQYQATLRTMAQELIGFTDVASLRDFVSQHVAEQMQLTSAQLIVQINGFALPAPPSGELSSSLREGIERWLTRAKPTTTYLLAEQLAHGTSTFEEVALKGYLDRAHIAGAVPGWLRDELVSFMVLGPKRTGEVFTKEDLEVLDALARQCALVIKNLELADEVHEQKRLAQLAELTFAVTHEFNNLLADQQESLIRMAKSLANPTALQQGLDDLQKLILQRGTYITKATSAYKNKSTTPLQEHPLARVITDAFTQAQQTQFAGSEAAISFSRTIDPALSFEGNATIPLLFLNLFYCLGWACEMTQESGALTIEASQAEQESLVIRLVMQGGADPSSLPAAHALAEELGKHGGLYLVVARLIVKDHQGQLTLETTPGGGTTFVIRLPQRQPDSSPLRKPLPQTSIF